MARLVHVRHNRRRFFDRLRHSTSFLDFLADEATRLGLTGAATAVTLTNATDTVNHAAHSYVTGDGPVQLGGTLPAELALLTDYWIIVTGAGTYQLATSEANAILGTVLAFSTDGASVTSQLNADRKTIFDFLSKRVLPQHRAERVRGETDIDNL